MVNSIGALDAITAYGRTVPGAGRAPAASAATPSALTPNPAHGGEASFGTMVADIVGTTASTIGKAEQASIKQIAGKGDLIDVATAIGAAETALDTMVAVRDRVVNAYNEIMRLQI